MKWHLAIVLPALLLAGCATSTIESRKQELYDAYASLTEGQRASVDAGHIAVGMPPDAVYIAWGKPSQVVASETSAAKLTSWLYGGTYLQSVTYWGYRPS